jgi:sugar/nucleoside kinase (ribokinase family)
MGETPDILCIGSVLWDVIGRAPSHMRVGSDVPGRISRHPGGVALNIAMALRRFGMRPALLSAVGRDAQGVELLRQCRQLGLNTDYVYVSDDLPTDRYMAVEGANGLIAAIADAHSLEAAGDKILKPLDDGPLGGIAGPYPGSVALDGNLTADLLARIARSPLFAVADLRVAPASPGKAARLMPFVDGAPATLYVNVEEAGLLCGEEFAGSEAAAVGLRQRGAWRAIVTDGANPVADLQDWELVMAKPPEVMVTRVTGAGDTFMAAHIAAEARGEHRAQALEFALKSAADYISGDVPT